jgi:hypothetical protein
MKRHILILVLILFTVKSGFGQLFAPRKGMKFDVR